MPDPVIAGERERRVGLVLTPVADAFAQLGQHINRGLALVVAQLELHPTLLIGRAPG
ncbi:MAG: hypothetical protein M5U19_11035 [Microthrixaceae bacterium]|nr:hypothetical protein [Microthrixaceae bacterium]